jgi:3-oxoacyl-[acyl-carrier protein] reductase
MDIRLDNHCAFVTGAARNLGRATALAFAEAGSVVICPYHKGKDDAEAVVAEIVAAGGRAHTVPLDLAEVSSIQAAVRAVEELGLTIDILVNNAANRPRSRIAEVTPEEWDWVLATNLRGPFFLAQAVIPGMSRQNWGRIINVSGVDAYRGNPCRPHNIASKMGMIGLSRALANETGRKGITVNTVVPGTMDTPRYHPELEGDPSIDTALREERVLQIPLARQGRPEEIGYACVFLSSDYSAYITGQELLVTGGLHPVVRQPALEYD